MRSGKIITLILLLGLSACSTTAKMNALAQGMSKSAVINVMGQPDSTAAKGDVEVLTYKLCRSGCMSMYDYYIQLKGGKVDGFGKMSKKALHLIATLESRGS